mmetsp:Transcript_12319/g.26597  ORF Transcript_12319/g.26597 Transcript_12319/m.26597 type:complete len:282 (+) Transcript_12319:568-1413(+)
MCTLSTLSRPNLVHLCQLLMCNLTAPAGAALSAATDWYLTVSCQCQASAASHSTLSISCQCEIVHPHSRPSQHLLVQLCQLVHLAQQRLIPQPGAAAKGAALQQLAGGEVVGPLGGLHALEVAVEHGAVLVDPAAVCEAPVRPLPHHLAADLVVVVHALAVALACQELALVDVAVAVYVGALALDAVLYKLAFIRALIRESKFPSPMLLVINIVSFIYSTVTPSVFPFPLPFSILHRSFIHIPWLLILILLYRWGRILHHTLPVRKSIFVVWPRVLSLLIS